MWIVLIAFFVLAALVLSFWLISRIVVQTVQAVALVVENSATEAVRGILGTGEILQEVEPPGQQGQMYEPWEEWRVQSLREES